MFVNNLMSSRLSLLYRFYNNNKKMSCIISLAKGFSVKAGVQDGVTGMNGKRIVESY